MQRIRKMLRSGKNWMLLRKEFSNFRWNYFLLRREIPAAIIQRLALVIPRKALGGQLPAGIRSLVLLQINQRLCLKHAVFWRQIITSQLLLGQLVSTPAVRNERQIIVRCLNKGARTQSGPWSHAKKRFKWACVINHF